MEEIQNKINSLSTDIQELRRNLGNLSSREVELKIIDFRKKVSEISIQLRETEKQLKIQSKENRDNLDALITMINDTKHDNDRVGGKPKGFLSAINWGLTTVISAFLGGFFLFIHLKQQNMEKFFYDVYTSSNSFVIITFIALFFFISQLAYFYTLLHIKNVNSDIKTVNKISFWAGRSLTFVFMIVLAICGLTISFFGYRTIFPLEFSILATISWVLVLFVPGVIFKDIDRFNDHEWKKYKPFLFILLWFVSLLLSASVAQLLSLNYSYDFSKILSRIGFVQSHTTWQKISNSYLSNANLNTLEINQLLNDFRHPKESHFQDSTKEVYLYGIMRINTKEMKIFCPYEEEDKVSNKNCRLFSSSDLTDVTNWMPLTNKEKNSDL